MTQHADALIINHPDSGFVSVVGDDACAFLQSIITANVEDLTVNACCPSALLTPQGRVLIDMMVYRSTTNTFFMRCDVTRRDELFTRLRKYRLRRPIEIAIETDIRLYLVIGKKLANRLGKQISNQVMTRLREGGEVLLTCGDSRSPNLGTHVLVRGDNIIATADKIDIWHKARIAAGIPEGAVDLTPERALMLEAGLDHLGAVDFNKGCYVGQEVTARTHYRGLIKRRLVPVMVSGTPPPLNSDVSWNGKVIGNSKTSAPFDNSKAVCLALLKLSEIHAILDSVNHIVSGSKNGGEIHENSNLTVNRNPASLAIPDWMMPLPRPKNSLASKI